MVFSQLHWGYVESSGIEGISEVYVNLAWVSIFLTESVRNCGDLVTDTPTLMQLQFKHLHTRARARAI